MGHKNIYINQWSDDKKFALHSYTEFVSFNIKYPLRVPKVEEVKYLHFIT